jgi:putative transposase
MPRRAFPVEKIINLLRETEVFLSQVESLEAICRKLSITRQTYYLWRKIYGGMRIEQAKRLKELERENERLKQLVGN